MRYMQVLISSAVFHIISLLFCLSTSVTSGYKGTVLAWSLGGSLSSFNELLLRRQLFSADDEDNKFLIASDPPTPDEPPEPQPQQQPQQPGIPDPQPAPAPEQPESQPPSRPLPRPQPVRIDGSPPGVNVPVPVNPTTPEPEPQDPGNVPPAPQPVGVPVPVPIPPIIPIPLPPPANQSPPPAQPRRPLLIPRPVTGSTSSDESPTRNLRLPAQPQIIPSGSGVSDYPTNEEIANAVSWRLLRGHQDKTVMYTEIGSISPARTFIEQFDPEKFLYMDVFPFGYTFQNGRSSEYYQDFVDRLCSIYSQFAAGTVYLISKYPYGPEFACSMWNRVEYPQLKANLLVDEIILVDYTNLERQRLFWNTEHGEIRYGFKPRGKRETTVTPCPDADSLVAGSVNVPPFPGAAADWGNVNFVQHQRKSLDANSQLDVSITNALGQEIGVLDGTIAIPGQEIVVLSQAPFAVRITVPASDDEPLHFKYGELTWESNDGARCTVDPWKGGVREGKCYFQY